MTITLPPLHFPCLKSELPTHTVSPCDTLLHVFTRTHTTHPISHGKKRSDFGPIRCIDILFTPRSPEVSDRRRVTKRDNRGRNSGREYIAEENLHLQTEQRGMLMTCGSIKY